MKDTHTRDPVSLTATYLYPVELGIAQVKVDAIKIGAKYVRICDI